MSATPESALMTNTTSARAAINGQLFIMSITLIIFTLHQTVGFDIGANLLQRFDLEGDFFQPTAIHQLLNI